MHTSLSVLREERKEEGARERMGISLIRYSIGIFLTFKNCIFSSGCC